MIWFLLTLPFKLLGLGFKTGRGSVKLTHRSVKLLGYRRLLFFGAGVGVGLLLAPGPGAELQAKLRAKLAELGVGGAGSTPAPAGGDLGARVREELSSSPRTWHLPQPSVAVDPGGRVTLTGAVPDTAAAGAFESVAAGVRGVTAVTNELAAGGSN